LLPFYQAFCCHPNGKIDIANIEIAAILKILARESRFLKFLKKGKGI